MSRRSGARTSALHERNVTRARKYYNGRSARLRQYMDRREKRVQKYRDRRGEQYFERHRRLAKRIGEHEDRVRVLYEETQIINRNRLKRIEDDRENILYEKGFKAFLFTGIVLFVMIMFFQTILPGTFLKRREVIDDTPIDELIELIPQKEYRDYSEGSGTGTLLTFPEGTAAGGESAEPEKLYRGYDGMSEEQILWDVLMEHFDGNRTAVLGIMCNLFSESEFRAGNLEDYNNRLWQMNDEEYTEKVNRRTINKKDFLESRTHDTTSGYYNEYEEWVNLDGGYGFAQYTSYDKKEGLYQFAEQWFAPGGPGEEYRFNIGDREMQARYLVYLLSSEEYASMDRQLRNAANTVDACHIWLSCFEVPYDPYNDDYYTLSFERAEAAAKIEAACGGETEEETEEAAAGKNNNSGAAERGRDGQ